MPAEAIRALGGEARQMEAEVQRLFPRARTLRWDRDAVEEAGEHEILLEHFASRRADVLVETLIIAKGLDPPSVTLVGMMLADVDLLLPNTAPRSALSSFSPRWRAVRGGGKAP